VVALPIVVVFVAIADGFAYANRAQAVWVAVVVPACWKMLVVVDVNVVVVLVVVVWECWVVC